MNAKCELLGRHVHLQRNGKCAVDISGQKIPLTKEERVAAYWLEQRSFDHTLPLARQENEYLGLGVSTRSPTHTADEAQTASQDIDNIQKLCSRCNTKKWAHTGPEHDHRSVGFKEKVAGRKTQRAPADKRERLNLMSSLAVPGACKLNEPETR